MNETIKAFLTQNQSILDKLTSFMLEYNKKVNLTRIIEPCEILEKHYIDSILPLTLYDVPRGTITLDVGSGAGFPGIPMKLYRPDLDVTLLDSSKKRTDYLKALINELKTRTYDLRFSGCRVITARSEELAQVKPVGWDSVFREKYGLVTARAVANLAALCEYCLPFVRVGGVFLAMKGDRQTVGDELLNSDNACELLGGEIQEVKEYTLPGGDKRSLVIIKKISQTPTSYPRRRVNIVKNPL